MYPQGASHLDFGYTLLDILNQAIENTFEILVDAMMKNANHVSRGEARKDASSVAAAGVNPNLQKLVPFGI